MSITVQVLPIVCGKLVFAIKGGNIHCFCTFPIAIQLS